MRQVRRAALRNGAAPAGRAGSLRTVLLFVYGTLRPFCKIPMAQRLAAHGEHLGEARLRGRLYDLGAYPGLLGARCGRDWVRGDVFRLRNQRTLLRALDRYEAGSPRGRGPRFARVSCVVRLGGRPRDAWVYVFRGAVLGGARISGGDYRAWSARERAAS